MLKKDFILESGESYGVDFLLKYNKNRLFIWGVYSLGKSTRWDGFQSYFPVFDRRHNLNLVGSYLFGKKKDSEVNVRWNLGSGLPFTPTAGFFQGVDVPGQTLSLVVIDKIPFPRPDDPLLSARRDEIGKTSFSEIDIPLAATQLAQAAGRLIRSRKDSGVVAILDPRLATKGYGKKLVSTLPPMKRTIEFSEVVQFLKSI